MADIMSYHYPASSSSGSVDYGSLPSLSHPHNGYHISADYSGSPSPHAMSQSVMQSQDHGDHSALAGEKRRNKLGYHRTSVACGHCRRRKIRCIPSPNDLQGRCINCIRLKKECSFYPVDQQPPPDTRKNSRSSVGHLFSSAHSAQSQSQSKTHIQTQSQTQPAPVQKPLPPPMASLKLEIQANGKIMPPPPLPGRSTSFSLPSSSVSTSPPPLSDAHIVPSHSNVQDTRQNPQLTMPSIQTMAPPMKEPYSPDKISGRNSFDYGNGLNNWMADASPNPSKEMGWRSYESPMTPSFPPTTYTTHNPANWTPQSESAGSRTGEDLWSYPQGPPRSLSFSSDTISSHQQSYPSISQMTRGAHHSSSAGSANGGSSYDRKSSSAALSDHLYNSPVSTATTIPGVDSIGTTYDQQTSLSAGSVYPVSSWTSDPYSYSKDVADPSYVSWATDTNPPASEAHAASSMYYTR